MGGVCVPVYSMTTHPYRKRLRLNEPENDTPELLPEMWREIFAHTGARARARCRRVCRAWYHALRGFVLNIVSGAVQAVRRMYLDPDSAYVDMMDQALLFPCLPVASGFVLQRMWHQDRTYKDGRFRRETGIMFRCAATTRAFRFGGAMCPDGGDPDGHVGFIDGKTLLIGGGIALPIDKDKLAALTNQLASVIFIQQ